MPAKREGNGAIGGKQERQSAPEAFREGWFSATDSAPMNADRTFVFAFMGIHRCPIGGNARSRLADLIPAAWRV
jgi:hypothetical protein